MWQIVLQDSSHDTHYPILVNVPLCMIVSFSHVAKHVKICLSMWTDLWYLVTPMSPWIFMDSFMVRT